GKTFIFQNDSITHSGNYYYKLQDHEGCDSVIQFRLDFVMEARCSCDLYFPNVFIPDGDNINDDFKVYNPCKLEMDIYELNVFRRWGKLVFSTTKEDDAWIPDLDRGEVVANETYLYVLQYRLIGQNVIGIKKGAVTMVR
ncbi:MAG: gliding motility-associated C-terminal domain-containing protein, partial [Bacteroidota bacterium]|nr:gliding motility-associated C-terminal domain-containing protein [Bacteroidota bacterium]